MSIRYVGKFLAMMSLWFCTSVHTTEAQIVSIGGDFSTLPLSRFIKVLETKGKPSLIKVKRDSLHYPFKTNYLDFIKILPTEHDRAYWLKLEVRNSTDERKQLIIEFENPHLKEIEFFEILDSKIVGDNHTGSRFEYDTRQEKHTTFLFRTRLAPQEQKEYYFYINHQGQGFTLHTYLYTTEAFYARLSVLQANVWLAVGAILMLSVVLWWFAGKFWNDFFASLALYVSSWGILVLIYSGHGFQLIWGSAYYWNTWSMEIFQALNAFFVVRMGCIFWRSYTIVPPIFRILRLCLYASGVILGGLLLMMYFEFYFPPFLRENFTGFWCMLMNVFVWLCLVIWEISVSKQIWNISIFVSSILLGVLLGVLVYRNPTLHYFHTEPIWLVTITTFNLYMSWIAMRRVHFVQNEKKLDQWLSIQRIRASKTNPDL